MTIKQIRTACGMTQAKFAETLGIPKRTIEDWESDRHKPPDYVVKLIEFYLKNQPEK